MTAFPAFAAGIHPSYLSLTPSPGPGMDLIAPKVTLSSLTLTGSEMSIQPNKGQRDSRTGLVNKVARSHIATEHLKFG